MIIVSSDTRNVNIILDNLQAKHLVNLLRETTMRQYVAASDATNADGFSSLATDVQSAVGTIVSVLGQHTSRIKWVIASAPTPVIPEDTQDEEELERHHAPPKETIH